MKNVIRSVGVASVAVAFGAGAALSAPIAGAQSSLPGGSLGGSLGDACGTEVVTPETLEASGWFTPTDETDAKIDAVDGAPESVGAAALTLPTDAAQGSSLYKNAERAPLADLLRDGENLTPLSYEYTADGQAPALQIRLNEANLAASEDRAGSDVGFATIVWSPPTAEGWKIANPGDSNQFWVTRTLEGDDGADVPSGTMMTLDEIINLNPDAVVTEYGVQKTRDNTADDVAIDNFTLGCETTNFELEAEDTGSLGDAFGSLEDMLPS